MNSELLAVIEYIEQERGLQRDVLVSALEKAILSASKKSIHPAKNLIVKVDPETGEIKAWAKLTVVDSIPTVDEIIIDRAKEKLPDVNVGDEIDWEVTPRNFGRIAAQTAKQAIMQQLRRAEKEIVKEEFEHRIGELVNGVVRRYESGNIIVDLQKAEGVLSNKDKIPKEKYHPGDRINALLLKVDIMGSGPSLVLSRSHPNFVRKLFEREVSEIHDGVVHIMGIAREPGVRTKIAVKSDDQRIDPIGACVGLRGMRVKNITGELSGERIDIIRYDDDVKTYATNALQPSKPSRIEVDEADHVLDVYVAQDQFKLALGKRGQNLRLSQKLVGWPINMIEEKVGETFQEKIDKAVTGLSDKLGIDTDLAEKLVNQGFLSVDGLKAADRNDILAIEGIDEEMADRLISTVQGIE